MLMTQRNRHGQEFTIDMDDKRFRIKPHQQIMSSCTGALITSLFSKFQLNHNNNFKMMQYRL